jgi:hypothetical protein
MALLQSLIGRRQHGRFRRRPMQRSGLLANPFARMALGGLAAYGARRWYSSRRPGSEPSVGAQPDITGDLRGDVVVPPP